MKSHGFSLIELLVVLAIIALLTSILLPALGAARDKARQTQCLTQLRSVGLMQAMYAQDHKHWLTPTGPTQQFGGGGVSPDHPGLGWVELLQHYNTMDAAVSGVASLGVPGFNCPQMPDALLISYFLSVRWAVVTQGRSQVNLDEVRHPSVWLMGGDCTRLASYPPPLGLGTMLFDDCDKDDAAADSFLFETDAGIDLHEGSSSALFGDSHVSSVTADALGDSMTFSPIELRTTWDAIGVP